MYRGGIVDILHKNDEDGAGGGKEEDHRCSEGGHAVGWCDRGEF